MEEATISNQMTILQKFYPCFVRLYYMLRFRGNVCVMDGIHHLNDIYGPLVVVVPNAQGVYMLYADLEIANLVILTGASLNLDGYRLTCMGCLINKGGIKA